MTESEGLFLEEKRKSRKGLKTWKIETKQVRLTVGIGRCLLENHEMQY